MLVTVHGCNNNNSTLSSDRGFVSASTAGEAGMSLHLRCVHAALSGYWSSWFACLSLLQQGRMQGEATW